jgi:hypothetical protein
MFDTCLRTQAIDTGIVSGIVPLDKPPNLGALAILVKKWDMTTSPPTDLFGIPGQGNPDPPSAFADHCVVRYGGWLYDPSYGKKWPSLLGWEDGSLDGFVYVNLITGAVVWQADTKGILETAIGP